MITAGLAGIQAESFALSSVSYFPGQDWLLVEPESQNMDSDVLEEMIAHLNSSGLTMHGLVLVRNGYIVAEQYWSYYSEITTHHLYSVTKSITSTLVGIAIKEGFIESVDELVLDFFSGRTIAHLDSQKESMTIADLLTMTPGVDWNEHNCSYSDPDNMYNQMFESADPVQFFLDLPMVHEPGTHWVYSTGASHILSAIITETTGMSAQSFANEYLFTRINGTSGIWNSDLQGINIGGTQLWITPRTMARVGLLLLNNGTWDSDELLTAEYAERATSPLVGGAYGDNYGYQWWMDTPNDLFMAIGSYGQYIIVSREYNLVIAITANTDHGSPLDEMEPYLEEALLDWHGGRGSIDPLIIVGAAAGTLALMVAIVFIQKRR
jgi:CubicO group peptidase (beta-lactamase class C family)